MTQKKKVKVKTPKKAPRKKIPARDKKTTTGGMLADEEVDKEIIDEVQQDLVDQAEEDLLNALAEEEGVEMAGVRLEAMSVATIQLLRKAKVVFITGAEGRKEMTLDAAMMEIAKFIYIMNAEVPIRERIIAVRDEEELEFKVMEFADKIPLDECHNMMVTIAKYVKSQTGTMVQPAPGEEDSVEDLLGNL